ncbi:MAG TPA: glucosaminidase domain-containing protein [Burkholderiaceae bacterium]
MTALQPRMAPEVFFPFVLAAAQKTQADTGIPASFTMAQAAVESAWDGSGLSQEDFNFFGIKAIGGWAGPTQMWPTREFLQGHYVIIQAPFRKYASLKEGFEDHAAFLTGNERYKPAFAHTGDSIAFARAVQAAGYATDPHYADTIGALITSHKLKQFDANRS